MSYKCSWISGSLQHFEWIVPLEQLVQTPLKSRCNYLLARSLNMWCRISASSLLRCRFMHTHSGKGETRPGIPGCVGVTRLTCSCGTPAWGAGDFLFWSRWIRPKKVATTLFGFVNHKRVLSLSNIPLQFFEHACSSFVWCNFMSWTQADPINSQRWSAELVHVWQTM